MFWADISDLKSFCSAEKNVTAPEGCEFFMVSNIDFNTSPSPFLINKSLLNYFPPKAQEQETGSSYIV